MKKLHTLISLLFIASLLNAQIKFQKTYGSSKSEMGYYIQPTSDGGYIISGTAFEFIAGTGWDAYLIKIAADGNIQWNKVYGTTQNEYAVCVKQTSDGGYILAGYFTNSPTDWRGLLIKTNSMGDVLWIKRYGDVNNSFFDVEQTTDGGYIVAGKSNNGTNAAAYLTKTDNQGNVLWTRKYSGGNTPVTFLWSVLQTADGGYLASGQTTSSLYMLKVNSAGDTLWNKSYGNGIQGGIMRKINDGGYILGGRMSAAGTSYALKIDDNGNVIWCKQYVAGGNYYIRSIAASDNGQFVALISAEGQTEPILILKLDNDGDFIWSKKYNPTGGSAYSETNSCIQPVNDGGYIFTCNSVPNDDDVYVVKMDENLVSGCNETDFIMSASALSVSTANIHYPITPANTTTNPLSAFEFSPMPIVNIFCMTSDITEVEINSINIFPNPTLNNFTITVDSELKNGYVEIYDLMGEKIYYDKLTEETIQLNPETGVYFVRVVEGKKVFSGKLIVE